MTAKAIPATMRAVEASGFGLGKLALVEKPVPVLQRGEILVQIKAATLNYRDLAIVQAGFQRLIHSGIRWRGDCSAVGSGVTRFKPGESRRPCLYPGLGGRSADTGHARKSHIRSAAYGVLRDLIAVPSEDAVATPSNLSDVESATLPIAALTTWTTLREDRVKPGDWVLVMGTDGVAIFALQFAKLPNSPGRMSSSPLLRTTS